MRALNELEQCLVLVVLSASLLALLVLDPIHEVAHILSLSHWLKYIIIEVALDDLLVLAIILAS